MGILKAVIILNKSINHANDKTLITK